MSVAGLRDTKYSRDRQPMARQRDPRWVKEMPCPGVYFGVRRRAQRDSIDRNERSEMDEMPCPGVLVCCYNSNATKVLQPNATSSEMGEMTCPGVACVPLSVAGLTPRDRRRANGPAPVCVSRNARTTARSLVRALLPSSSHELCCSARAAKLPSKLV
jgi:hypothetical protein